MKLCVFTAAFCTVLVACSADRWTFETCSSGKSIATLRNFALDPDPVNLSGGNVTVSLDIQLHEDVPEGSVVKLKLWNVVNVFISEFNYPLDCPLSDGCTVDHCKFLRTHKDEECVFFPKDVECECPLKANTYRGKKVFAIPYMARKHTGKYKIEIQLLERHSSRQLLCYTFIGYLKA